MINKRNVLGKEPLNLGDKDAVHVAIVAVKACQAIKRGSGCSINQDGYAESGGDVVGYADPYRASDIEAGEVFWLLVKQQDIPSVKHTWEHPTVNFPTELDESKAYSQWFIRSCESIGLPPKTVMEACNYVVENDRPMPWNKEWGEWDDSVNDDLYDLWSEYEDMSGYEFEDMGTACCPEKDYPYALFSKPEED